MTIDELMSKTEILKDKTFETAYIGEITNKENSHKFKYPGIYILTDKNDGIVYIGSAYARNLRDRLMQYHQTRNSGNNSLYLDLIDAGLASEENAYNYILSLKINAYESYSDEYKLIEIAGVSIVNKMGK